MGLKVGTHQFDFQLDKTFFNEFEASPIADGSVNVQVELDKRSDMLLLHFNIEGKVATQCDRCLADINLPFTGEHDLIVKYLPEEGNTAPELVFIDREATELDISTFVYEFVCLSFPMIKTYDCEEDDPVPCNDDLLDILDGDSDDDNTPENPIWDALKDLK